MEGRRFDVGKFLDCKRRKRGRRCSRDWSSDVCSSDLTYGAGKDTCCYARPDVGEKYPTDGETGVCRNALVNFDFTQLMDGASLASNVSLQANYGANVCPGTASWLSAPFMKVTQFIRGLIFDSASAADSWCNVPIRLETKKKIITHTFFSHL